MSAIKAQAAIVDPDSIVVRISLAFTIGTWKELLAGTNENRYPGYQVASAIKSAIGKLTASAEATVDTTG